MLTTGEGSVGKVLTTGEGLPELPVVFTLTALPALPRQSDGCNGLHQILGLFHPGELAISNQPGTFSFVRISY